LPLLKRPENRTGWFECGESLCVDNPGLNRGQAIQKIAFDDMLSRIAECCAGSIDEVSHNAPQALHDFFCQVFVVVQK
jgi:hypothetical protein